MKVKAIFQKAFARSVHAHAHETAHPTSVLAIPSRVLAVPVPVLAVLEHEIAVPSRKWYHFWKSRTTFSRIQLSRQRE